MNLSCLTGGPDILAETMSLYPQESKSSGLLEDAGVSQCLRVSTAGDKASRGAGAFPAWPPFVRPRGEGVTAAKAAVAPGRPGGATAVMWTAGTSRAAPQPQGRGSALGRPTPCPPGGVGLGSAGSPVPLLLLDAQQRLPAGHLRPARGLRATGGLAAGFELPGRNSSARDADRPCIHR